MITWDDVVIVTACIGGLGILLGWIGACINHIASQILKWGGK
jgi:hypothetical protein